MNVWIMLSKVTPATLNEQRWNTTDKIMAIRNWITVKSYCNWCGDFNIDSEFLVSQPESLTDKRRNETVMRIKAMNPA